MEEAAVNHLSITLKQDPEPKFQEDNVHPWPRRKDLRPGSVIAALHCESADPEKGKCLPPGLFVCSQSSHSLW